MFCSGLIIFDIYHDKRRLKKLYHRLLLALSITDTFTSFSYALSTWPIPLDSPNIYAALGTQATCTAQGFFIQASIATPMYNAMLSIYYLLTVRYGWKENQLKKVEKYFFGIPIMFGLATAVASVVLKLFNNANLWCWISPLPLTCKGSLFNNGINDCERGNNASLYRFLFFYGPLWFVIITASIAMFLLYTSVRKTEQQAAKWSLATRLEKTARLKHSQKVRRQAFFYLMAFYVAWLPGTLLRTIQTINTSADTSVLLFIFAITGPFQGTLNFLVYVRPKYLKYRKKHPENLCLVMQMMVFPCCMKEDPSGDNTRIMEPIVGSRGSILAELQARGAARKTIQNKKSCRKSSSDEESAQSTKIPNGESHDDEEVAQSSKIPNEESHSDEESKKLSQIPTEESQSDEESKQSFKIANRQGHSDEESANAPSENSQDHPMEDSHNDSSVSFVEND